MKGTFIALVSVASLATLTSVASAQTATKAKSVSASTSTANAATTKPAQAAQPSTVSTKPADPATLSTTSPASASASTSAAVAPTGAGTSTASLPDAVAAVKKKAFRAEFYNRNTLPKQAFNNSEGAPGSSNYGGLRYVIGNGKSVSVRQPFTYSWPKTGAQGQATTSDMYLNFTDSKLADFGNDLTMIGVFRAYLPTGEKSRFVTKQNGSLFAWFILQQAIGKFEVSYQVIPTWFNQSQNGYLNGEGVEVANKDYAVSQFFDFVYNISDKWSVDQTVGTDNTWFRPISGQNTTREHALSLMSTVTYQPMAELGISAILSNDVNIYNASQPFRLYRDEEITAMLLISANVGIL